MSAATASTASTAASSRLPGLDGLRGIAVVLVVGYHLFPGLGLSNGFIGVDVFFVLSGFLITTLLLREHAATGRISLGRFWMRRARRLLPALALVVVVSGAQAWLVGGEVLVRLGTQVAGAATFSYNWVAIAAGGSYFAGAEPELLRNLWSLAVEEQFYLLWPLLLPLVLLVRGRRMRVVLALGAAAGSAALMALVLASGADATRVYYGTDTHAFGLLIGVALAFAFPVLRAAPRVATGLGVLGLSALLLLAWAPVTAPALVFPWVLLAASVATAAVIIGATSPGAPLGRMLDAEPLRWIGERSYGIYLWHWPLVVLIVYERTGATTEAGVPVLLGVAALVATVGAAALSYRFMEAPIRRLGFGGFIRRIRAQFSVSPARRLAVVGAVAVGALAVGGTTAAVAATGHADTSAAAVAAGARAIEEAQRGDSETADPATADVGGAATPAPVATPTAERGVCADTERSVQAQTPAAPQPSTAAVSQLPSAPASPSPRPTGPLVDDSSTRPCAPSERHVTGDRVSAVGDSVMLASAPGLLQRLPGVDVDAEVSRSVYAGAGILDELAASGQLRDYVVVALGTNGPVDDEVLTRMRAAVAPRPLVLVNASGPRDWIPDVNETLAAFAARTPGVEVADWDAAIAPHPELLAADRIHPGAAGGEVFADTVAETLDAIENRRARLLYRVELLQHAG